MVSDLKRVSLAVDFADASIHALVVSLVVVDPVHEDDDWNVHIHVYPKDTDQNNMAGSFIGTIAELV
jgi:hypothetical protein